MPLIKSADDLARDALAAECLAEVKAVRTNQIAAIDAVMEQWHSNDADGVDRDGTSSYGSRDFEKLHKDWLDVKKEIAQLDKAKPNGRLEMNIFKNSMYIEFKGEPGVANEGMNVAGLQGKLKNFTATLEETQYGHNYGTEQEHETVAGNATSALDQLSKMVAAAKTKGVVKS